MKLKGKPYREYKERRERKRFKTSLERRCCGSWLQWDGGDSTCLVRLHRFCFFVFYSSFISENRWSDTKLCNLVTGKGFIWWKTGTVKWNLHSPPFSFWKSMRYSGRLEQSVRFKRFLVVFCEDSVPARGPVGEGCPWQRLTDTPFWRCLQGKTCCQPLRWLQSAKLSSSPRCVYL